MPAIFSGLNTVKSKFSCQRSFFAICLLASMLVSSFGQVFSAEAEESGHIDKARDERGKSEPRFRSRPESSLSRGLSIVGRKPLDFSVLELSEEQKEKIQELRAANAIEARKISGQLRREKKLLIDLLFDGEATKEQILSKNDKVRELQRQIENLMIEDFLGIRGQLSEAQLKNLSLVRPKPVTSRVKKE